MIRKFVRTEVDTEKRLKRLSVILDFEDGSHGFLSLPPAEGFVRVYMAWMREMPAEDGLIAADMQTIFVGTEESLHTVMMNCFDRMSEGAKRNTLKDLVKMLEMEEKDD